MFYRKKPFWVRSVFLLIVTIALYKKYILFSIKPQLLNSLLLKKPITIEVHYLWHNFHVIFQEMTNTLIIIIHCMCSWHMLQKCVRHQCNWISDHLSRSKPMYIYISLWLKCHIANPLNKRGSLSQTCQSTEQHQNMLDVFFNFLKWLRMFTIMIY